MRTVLIVLASVAALSVAGAADGRIDLNKPGAMEQLQRNNPRHYAKITTILEGLAEQPDEQVPQWMKTTFEAKNVIWAPLVLTSYPPRKRLSFELETIQYEARNDPIRGSGNSHRFQRQGHAGKVNAADTRPRS
jgi:hypothetical protein